MKMLHGLSKTGLNLKFGQVVPKLWNNCQTLPKYVYREIRYSYGPLVLFVKLSKIRLDFWNTLYVLCGTTKPRTATSRLLFPLWACVRSHKSATFWRFSGIRVSERRDMPSASLSLHKVQLTNTVNHSSSNSSKPELSLSTLSVFLRLFL